MLKEIKGKYDVITNVDLFNGIVEAIKESSKWPEGIIDYAIPTYDTIKLYNYEFEPMILISEGCEGYYLDLSINGDYGLNEENGIVRLGSIKTLEEGDEAIRQMAALYGECFIAYKKIIYENLDALSRIGYDLHFLDKEGNQLGIGFSSLSKMESVLERFYELHEKEPEKYYTAVVRDNLTRKVNYITVDGE